MGTSKFALFCDRIGAEYNKATDAESKLFDVDRVEAVFRVKEYAFDAAALAHAMRDRLRASGVRVQLNARATKVSPTNDGRMEVSMADGGTIRARMVLHCTYAELNQLPSASGSPMLSVQQEVVEIALVRLPDPLAKMGWTIMDGPFCSSLPFPALQARSLYHVRYSVHGTWSEGEGAPRRSMLDALATSPPETHVRHMLNDGKRYVPLLAQAEHLRSLFTVRTKLPGSARTDSRPILFRAAPDMPHMHHVIGGKIDNVYDLEPFLDAALQDAFGSAL